MTGLFFLAFLYPYQDVALGKWPMSFLGITCLAACIYLALGDFRKLLLIFLVFSPFQKELPGDFGGAIFYDGGAVYVSDSVIRSFKDPYRDSAGVGIHIKTPVGPVVLEYGWKLDREPDE